VEPSQYESAPNLEAVPETTKGDATMNLMLVRLGFDQADVQIDLSDAGGGTDDGCGGGFWCPACRAEIRAEAFAWLHALSEAYPMGTSLHSRWGERQEAEPAPKAPRDWPVARPNGVYEIHLDPSSVVRGS
jgi:hypothetical protein